MDTGLIASRYARALVEYAASRNEEVETYGEVRKLIGAFRSERTLRDVLLSPVLAPAAKMDIVRRLFDRPLGAALEGFLQLVLRHHREHYLEFMLHSYTELYKRRHNIRDALLVTASPVDAEFVGRVCRTAESRTHSEVHLRSEVRPELIGGFVFRMDDVLIDASIAAQLRLLRRKLGSKPNRIV